MSNSMELDAERPSSSSASSCASSGYSSTISPRFRSTFEQNIDNNNSNVDDINNNDLVDKNRVQVIFHSKSVNMECEPNELLWNYYGNGSSFDSIDSIQSNEIQFDTTKISTTSPSTTTMAAAISPTMESPRGDLKRPDLKGSFRCSICQKIFCHSSSLSRHRMQAHFKSHTCTICLRQVKRKEKKREIRGKKRNQKFEHLDLGEIPKFLTRW